MADRKVLIKYFPKNFDHQRLVKRGRGKDKLMNVRNMLPMSLRCNVCANYLYIGTKFNMRMQICNEESYLGIKIFRFYFKCTSCYGQITFKTDPKNHDYIVETGGTRNYEPIKDAQHAEKLLKKMKVDEKEGDSMKYLEHKSYDSKREMELMEALDDIKNLNKRQGVIDPEDLLKSMLYEQEMSEKFTQEEERTIDLQYQQLRKQYARLPVIQEQDREEGDIFREEEDVNRGVNESGNVDGNADESVKINGNVVINVEVNADGNPSLIPNSVNKSGGKKMKIQLSKVNKYKKVITKPPK